MRCMAMAQGNEGGQDMAAAGGATPLLEGWMLLRGLFPLAMAQVLRRPPANDPD